MPPEEEQQEEEIVNPLDTWFEKEPEKTPEKEVEVIPEKKEEIETETEDDDDYEAPLKKKEEPEEDDVEKLPESKARERAKIEGKRRKELEQKLQEKELEFDRITAELETHRSKLTEIESASIDPFKHPDYVGLVNEIKKDVKDEVDDLDAPHKSIIIKNLGDFIVSYRNADSHEDRDSQLALLKDNLAENLFGEDSTFESLDKDDRKEVSAALRIIKKSSIKSTRLDEIYNDLSNKAQTGTLAIGTKEYERSISELKPILDAIGDLPDDVIEANPYAIESLVATKAKLPEGKKRLANAIKDVTALVTGLAPLTQTEIDKIKANGGNVKEFQAARFKAHEDKKKKLIPLLVQGLMTRSDLKEMGEKLSKFEKKKASQDNEHDALSKIRKKTAEPQKDIKVKDPLDIWFDNS